MLEIPWTEKYRPKNFDDIVSQNIAINNLRNFTKNSNLPHFLFLFNKVKNKEPKQNQTHKILIKHKRTERD